MLYALNPQLFPRADEGSVLQWCNASANFTLYFPTSAEKKCSTSSFIGFYLEIFILYCLHNSKWYLFMIFGNICLWKRILPVVHWFCRKGNIEIWDCKGQNFSKRRNFLPDLYEIKSNKNVTKISKFMKLHRHYLYRRSNYLKKKKSCTAKP